MRGSFGWPTLFVFQGDKTMKITVEVKDNPRGRAPIRVEVDQTIHRKINVHALVAHIKKLHPWAKQVDIRIDLR